MPDTEMVIVFAVDMYAGGDMEFEETRPMLETILTARDIPDLAVVRAKVKPKAVAAGGRVRIVAKSGNEGLDPSVPTRIDFYLSHHPDQTTIMISCPPLPLAEKAHRS